jgi:hypothetical protein
LECAARKRTKVAENDRGVVGCIHKGSAAEERGEGQSRDRHTALVGPLEDPRRMAFLSKTEQRTGGDVQIRVGSAEGEEENAGVENVGQCLDASKPDGDNKGRSRCLGTGLVDSECKFGGVVGNEHAQEENGEAVEEEDSVEGELDGARNRLAGVLCLSDSDTDQFRTEIGEDSVDEGAPETVEFACRAGAFVRLERSRVLVVLESSRVAGTGANCKQEGEDNHADLEDVSQGNLRN